jgi:hypothetical protein
MESGIHKRGFKSNLNNYRGILMTSIINRLCGRILIGLIEKKYNNLEEEEQSRYRAGRSCIDNIFFLKQVIKKRCQVIKRFIAFIDLQKTYNTVSLMKLWEALQG